MANLKDLIVNGSARIIGNLYANLKGNSDTATKLETPRTIRTNLGSTSTASFDGSANITPGIQGTLSVANGGTGQTTIANIQAGKDADGNIISETYSTKTELDNKVTKNTNITAGTATKITYDSKGLVTAGTTLSAGDIPDISSTYQTKVSSSNKLNADYISDGTTNKTVTATEKSTWNSKQDALVSGTNIKTINNNSILGSGDLSIDSLPSQTGQSGKFLTTNGTTASWTNIPNEIPSQSGQSGKFLTTNGTSVSWGSFDDTNYLTLDGTQTITGSKTFTGTVTAITQASTDNSTKVATTAFVQSVAGGGVTITYDSINKKLIFA